MDIVHPQINDYIDRPIRRPTPVLGQMESFAAERGFPIIGPQAGLLLHLLTRSIAARRILELGSGFGYSAMWIATALPEGGRVVLTDRSQENRERALAYAEAAGLADRIEYHLGEALEVAASLTGPFDLILCDMDKKSYPRALPVARSLLRIGGYLVCDNMLWSGRVVESRRDAETDAIRTLTDNLAAATDFITTLLPVHDGLSVSLRVS